MSARRLTLAVACSIGVHAAALGMYRPAATAGPGNASNPVLHAFIAPSQHEPSPVAPASLENQGSADVAGGGAGGLPTPDRWFKRSELDAVAAPMTEVELDYPEGAKWRRAAQVQVRLFIDERGVVRKVTIDARGPERAFDDVAVRAWHRVRFSPAVKNGVPVKSQQVIEVDFHPELALR